MQVTWISTLGLLLSSPVLVIAKPVACGQPPLKPDQLITIAPESSTCQSAPAAGECRTAAQAVPHIVKAFQTYNIASPGEQAALISLMAFETADFKYNINHFPGVPGQGTRNMQSPDYNVLYAKSIPALEKDLAPIIEQPKAVLDLLLTDDDYDFGSAAWFLATQCPEKIRAGLRAGTEEGWRGYITSCVGTTVTEDRKVIWERARKALQVVE
ncbi:hypothetical protein FQN54_005389 [Arachnomyces sp. PD_36]|nr:hypothetical protein FQN54_005389 [Arachnomyces sp. PD_36]